MNIGSYLASTADRRGDETSVIFGDSRWTYRETQDRVAGVATWLARAGIRPGDRVAVLMWNCPELLETMFAVWQAGAVLVPVNARLVAAEVEFIVRDSAATGFVFDEDHGGVVSQLGSQTLAGKVLLGVRTSQRKAASFARAAKTPAAPMVDVTADDPAWLFYTSGTTGRPKGAVLSHGVLNFVSVAWCADLLPVSDTDVGLHAAPLSHGAGFHALALTLRGCAQVIAEPGPFHPSHVFALIEQHRVTNTWLVPTQIKVLTDALDARSFDLSSLQCIIYGGAPMYEEDLRRALERFGPVFVQIYAQGETPMTATFLPRADHVGTSAPLNSCGYARSGVEVAVLDDSGSDASRGMRGEICIKGPSVFSGYWGQPEATAEKLRGGWLHTGDIGYMDERGYVFLLDRVDDMVISGGSNVYPREVEEVLAKHPAIQEVCVFGVPDPHWGEAVRAAIVVRPGAAVDASELIAYCRSGLAGYKIPRAFDFVAELPRSAYGKTLRRLLREPYWRDEGRMVR